MNLEKAQKLWYLLNRFDRSTLSQIDLFALEKEKYPFFYLLYWNEKHCGNQQRKIALKSNSRINYFKSIYDAEIIDPSKNFESCENISLAETNQAQIIEDFLSKMPSITKVKKNSPENDVDFSEMIYNPPTTESYAIILENQGKFDLAIHVYEKLSLAKPEKRLYFASRISEIALKLNN